MNAKKYEIVFSPDNNRLASLRASYEANQFSDKDIMMRVLGLTEEKQRFFSASDYNSAGLIVLNDLVAEAVTQRKNITSSATKENIKQEWCRLTGLSNHQFVKSWGLCLEQHSSSMGLSLAIEEMISEQYDLIQEFKEVLDECDKPKDKIDALRGRGEVVRGISETMVKMSNVKVQGDRNTIFKDKVKSDTATGALYASLAFPNMDYEAKKKALLELITRSKTLTDIKNTAVDVDYKVLGDNE